MLSFSLLFPVSAFVTNCGGEVTLEDRPCPCSDDWTCCPEANICAPRGACPPPAMRYCRAGWILVGEIAGSTLASKCIYDVDIVSKDVCHYADAPTIQADVVGTTDYCGMSHDGFHRSFGCGEFVGKTYLGMLVTTAEHPPQPGYDRCRLSADALDQAP